MVSCLFIKLIIISKFFVSSIVNYKFGSNFGQIVYDYSNSGNHATNGYYMTSDMHDTLSTDRGAYFLDQNRLIRLPPNEKVPNLGNY